MKKHFLILFVIWSGHLADSSVDEFMSCDNYFESKRKGRVLDLIPCDMERQSFCNEKGPAYPERAIWKFKEENRALMRRLYGDLESNSVYREMRSVNVDSSSSHMSRAAKAPDLTFTSAFSSLEYNIRVGSGLATVQSASEPFIVPSSVGRVKIKRKIMKKKRKEDSSEVRIITSTTTSTSSVYATTSESPSPTATTDPTQFQTTFQATVADDDQLTTNTIMPTDTMTTFEEIMTTTLEPATPQSTNPDVSSNPDTVETTINLDSTIPDVVIVDEPEAESKENVGVDLSEKVDQGEDVESEVEDEEEFEYEEMDEETGTPVWSQQVTTGEEGDEDHLEVEYTGTPVNACPVKEEVFAPYWANNTRNQVLALLNLYPFEQYIHMETCKYEKEEMLCRQGCRCEQQYRLHRLLAFDPSNECRGIFSDWFRFPSYCICKCYNIPPDFLEQKRKPRVELTPATPEREEESKSTPNLSRSTETDDLSFSNIPAILPYEAKEALLRELSSSRSNRKLTKEPEQKISRANGRSGSGAQRRLPVAVNSEEEKLDEHFFYGNPPVIDYKLSDGSQGAVDQIPRR